ncbi:MAG TPA: adenylate/guanylate cyclase domain-containing protein [Blastocatellia bacterium]|nr:adenylate/guanylate cyclase domain-containing protein [Blastocatellia bacterium]
MQERLGRTLSAVIGDPRRFSLEHRLFNIISLINAVTNIAGAFWISHALNRGFLLILHLLTGALFLFFFYLSRTRGLYRQLYWPLVILMGGFLFTNALANAGSLGGAHYYFIPALAIAVILSDSARNTIIATLAFAAATVSLLLIEYYKPQWITGHASDEARLVDILGNLVFVQVFTAIIVMVLARTLNQEREKSDRLLLNILPQSIADELKARDRVQPLNYESATVLFTDFVGFTRIAERLTPEQLIEELDLCFRQFDQIARRHNLEKIKTIGDAYMAAGGIPQANSTHAIDSVLCALEILRFMEEMRVEKEAAGQTCWQLRLGIHTGSLVAGVIGQEKFAYDVWGDTVNTASRMESSGVAGRVNISMATYELVKEFFVCEHRGRITAKNKGDIDMYLVVSIRPDLSLDGDGKTPGKSFFMLYDRIARTELSSRSQARG